MTGKLFKHEFLRTRALLGVLLGVATLFTLVGVLAGLTGLPVVAGLGRLLALVGAFAPLPAVQVGLAIDYWRSSYRRTGYFTQTLPVRGATQFWVKLGWGVLVSLVATLLTVILGTAVALSFAAAEGKGVADLLRAAGGAWQQLVAVMPVWGWVALPVLVVAGVASNLIQYYFAASVGSERRFNQMGAAGPIVVWIGLYIASQVLGFLSLFLVPLGLGAADGKLAIVGVNWLEAMATNTNPEAMPFGIIPMILLLLAVLVWRTRFSWEKRVALV